MLTVEEKKFAYNKYSFNSSIDTILNFMYPVSKLDEKIEEAKTLRKKYIGYAAIFYTLSAIISSYYFLYNNVFNAYNWGDYYRWLIFASSVVPFVFICNLEGPARDVDNDLNNFIIPFLEKIQKYIDPSTRISLITDLGPKLGKDKKAKTETYADSYEYSWFSAKFPLADDLNVLLDLTDNISFYGKKTKSSSENLKVFSNLSTKIVLRFVFKKDSYKHFSELKNCELSWEAEGGNTILVVNSTIKRNVEFYIPSANTVGLLFDNNYCLNLIDTVYARLRGIGEEGFTPETLRSMAADLKEKARKLELEAQGLLDKADAIEAELVDPSSIIEMAEKDGDVEYIEEEEDTIEEYEDESLSDNKDQINDVIEEN